VFSQNKVVGNDPGKGASLKVAPFIFGEQKPKMQPFEAVSK